MSVPEVWAGEMWAAPRKVNGAQGHLPCLLFSTHPPATPRGWGAGLGAGTAEAAGVLGPAGREPRTGGA